MRVWFYSKLMLAFPGFSMHLGIPTIHFSLILYFTALTALLGRFYFFFFFNIFIGV